MNKLKKEKKILLKLSGQALEKSGKTISRDILDNILFQIKTLKKEYDLKIAIVVGGGNIFRGKISDSIGLGKDTEKADYMGMLSTTINAIALNTFFNNNGLKSNLFNSLQIQNISDKFNLKKAKKLFNNNEIIVFGGGTGKPYVSTDTAAVLRAIELDAEEILIAKNGIDGLYDKDPKEYKEAKFIEKTTFDFLIKKKLQVIDLTASEMLNESNKNIIVTLFNMNTKNNIINLFNNEKTKKTIIIKKK